MSEPNVAQRQWLGGLGAMGGGSRALATVLAEPQAAPAKTVSDGERQAPSLQTSTISEAPGGGNNSAVKPVKADSEASQQPSPVKGRIAYPTANDLLQFVGNISSLASKDVLYRSAKPNWISSRTG